MAKIHDILVLAEYEAGEVSGSPQDWMRYLDTASRLYRYPFSDTHMVRGGRTPYLWSLRETQRDMLLDHLVKAWWR